MTIFRSQSVCIRGMHIPSPLHSSKPIHTPQLITFPLNHSPIETTMMMSTRRPAILPSIRAITLIAEEETLAPLGSSSTTHRPIGFASVFLSIENPVEAEYHLIIKSLRVVDTLTGEVLLHQATPQSITLMPLENPTFDVYLTNQTGYGEAHHVKAIARYQVIDVVSDTSPTITSVIESEIVTVKKQNEPKPCVEGS